MNTTLWNVLGIVAGGSLLVWLVARIEDVAWNVDISEQMTAEGP